MIPPDSNGPARDCPGSSYWQYNASMQNSKNAMASSAEVKLKKPTQRGAGPVRRVSLEIPLDLWKKAKQGALDREESLRDLLLRSLTTELEKQTKRSR